MANKKNNKNMQAKKAVKPQAKPAKKVVQTIKAKKPMPAKTNKVNAGPAKIVKTKKVSIESIPQTISYTKEERAFKIGKYTIKKTHALVAAAVVVVVLLCVLF